jgi:imidazole glycerol phosphate synthase glutamine amidotransferase subunit
MKIALVEYGAGNLPSVERALARLGADTFRAPAPELLGDADAIILPGVGHFGALMRQLGERGMIDPLRERISPQDVSSRAVPFLGICLGLQALFSASDEAPDDRGFGIYNGRVSALPPTAKLPHMGWNRLERVTNSRLLEGIPDDAYFYFANSFAALPGATGLAHAEAALCDHGGRFVAVVENGSICGVQFHPEKSGQAGARLLQNFLRLAQGYAKNGSGQKGQGAAR